MKDKAAFPKYLAGMQLRSRKPESECAPKHAHTHSCPEHASEATQSLKKLPNKLTGSDVTMCIVHQKCIHLCLHSYGSVC